MFGSMRCSVVQQFLSVCALLRDAENLNVVFSQCHLLHAVGSPAPVDLGEEQPHGWVERVRL